MFSTTLAAAALGGLLVSGSIAPQPAWQTDYRAALTRSVEEHKPLAVFIAPGGHTKAVADGKIGIDAAVVLRQSYVCLAVDTTTADGQAVAGAFGLNEGLVISDKTGGVQALRHQGAVPAAELTKYLTTYSNTAVAQTVYVGTTTYYSQPSYPQQPTGPIRQAFGNVRQFFGGS